MNSQKTELKLDADSISTLDRVGIGLSLLCLAHCLIMPLSLLSLPIMARYYVTRPWVHFLLAALILPIGIFAFRQGQKKHHKMWIAFMGFLGLAVVVVVPILVHVMMVPLPEIALMIIGSAMLMSAHLWNARACRNC